MSSIIDKLKEEENKIRAKLDKVKKQKEKFEEKVALRIPVILEKEYPEIYAKIRERVIEEISKLRKKTNPKTEKAENKKKEWFENDSNRTD